MEAALRIQPKEKDFAFQKPFPSLLQAFGLLGYIIIFSIGLLLPFMIFFDNLYNEIAEAIVYVGSILLVISIANKKRRSGNFSLRTIPVGLYFLILLIVPAWIIVIEPIINLIPLTEWGKKLFEGFIPSNFIRIGLIVVAAPILEELLFRGIILDGFLKRYSPWKAILLSSFLFGLIHLNPWQFIVAFGLGIMLGWLYWKTGSLLPCIFLHYVNNTLATISSLTIDPFTTFNQNLNNPVVYGIIFLSCCLILLGSILLAGRVLKFQKQ